MSFACFRGAHAVVACVTLSAVGCIHPVSPLMHLRDEPVAKPDKQVAPAAPPHGGARVAIAAPEEPEVVSLPVAGTAITSARVTVAVHAPIDRVRAIVFAMDRYPEFMPNYRLGRVVSSGVPGGRILDMEIEQLGGMVKLRARVEISPPRFVDDREMYEGRFIEGNVAAFVPKWELRALDAETTLLTVESYMDPKLPVPDSFINSGNVDGMRGAILALKRRAEGPTGAP
jgi:hypothetical protein